MEILRNIEGSTIEELCSAFPLDEKLATVRHTIIEAQRREKATHLSRKAFDDGKAAALICRLTRCPETVEQ